MPHNINSDRMFLPNALLLGEVEKTLADGRTVALNATGNSMLPFIIGGQLQRYIYLYEMSYKM